MALSGHPALGERCDLASRSITLTALPDHEHSANKKPVSLAGIRLAASSSRAAAMPNASYRSLRWPIMESSVLIALYAKRPGRPKITPQKMGAVTPSEVFSAKLSIAAREMAASSRLAVSRPTMCDSASRAGARSSVEKARFTAAT